MSSLQAIVVRQNSGRQQLVHIAGSLEEHAVDSRRFVTNVSVKELKTLLTVDGDQHKPMQFSQDLPIPRGKHYADWGSGAADPSLLSSSLAARVPGAYLSWPIWGYFPTRAICRISINSLCLRHINHCHYL